MADDKIHLTGLTVTVNESLHDLVHAAASLYPDNIALLFDDCTSGFNVIKYTYSQLMHMALLIKNILLRQGCSQAVIGVICQDQPTLPAWLIGILSTPAAFLPLSSDITKTRLRDLIKRLSLRIILADEVKKQKLQALVPDLIDNVNDMKSLMNESTVMSPEVNEVPCDVDLYLIVLKTTNARHSGFNQVPSLAYVITTSGTTGSPKIVKVPHQCITPNIVHISEIYKLSPSDCVYQASPLTFDPSIVEIFTRLQSGATLLLLPEDIRKHPQDLARHLCTHHVTVLQATPSLISSIGAAQLSRTLLSKETSLRVLALGGERCPSWDTIETWRAPGNQTSVINLYGITEVSSWATYHMLTEEDKTRCAIPLGVPLYNTVISLEPWHETSYDDDSIGQIYIGGMTRVCCIDDEILSDDISPTMRATGDLIRHETGDLYYVGRIDEQVKRSGKRINLIEIENVCEQYEGVLRAAVVLDNPRLYLFIIPHEDLQRTDFKQDVEAFLQEHLPHYSFPSDIIMINKIPITQHGKINKEELLNTYYEDKINAQLSTLWKRYTHQSSEFVVPPNAKFIDCGGDSLSALQFIETMETKLLGYHTPDNVLLDTVLNGTFSCLVRHIWNELHGKKIPTSAIQRTSLKQEVEVESISKTSHHPTRDIAPQEDNQTTNVTDIVRMISDNQDSERVHSHSAVGTHTENLVTKVPDTSSDVSTVPPWKKFKHSENLSEAVTEAAHILSVSRTSQIWIHSDSGMTAIDPDRLQDVCHPVMKLEEIWRFNMGKCVDCSPLLVINRSGSANVYIGSHSKQCTFAALDVNSGREMWSLPLYTRIEATPNVSKCGQFVIVGAYDHNVYVFEAASGVLHWKFSTGDQVKDSPCVSPVSGLVFIGSHDHRVYCLDIKVKHCVWQVKTDGCVFASPCISTKPYHLYTATTKGSLYCMHPDSGAIVWHLCLTSPIFSTPSLTPGGICVGTVDHVMYLLTHEGEKVWSFSCDGPIFSSPCIYPTSPSLHRHSQNDAAEAPASFCCVFGCHSSHVFCLTHEGHLLWRHKMSSQVYSSPFVITDGSFSRQPVVVVCCTNGDIDILDLEEGHILGHHSIPSGQIFSSPVVWTDKLIIGCRDNNVYCFNISLHFKHFR